MTKEELDKDETYQLQMAAISCAAMGWLTDVLDVDPEYRTPALKDVIYIRELFNTTRMKFEIQSTKTRVREQNEPKDEN
jgi:hypothetical protein